MKEFKSKLEKLKNNLIFKIVTVSLKVILTIMIVLFLLMVCLQRFSDNKISFFNYRIFTVVSGSMVPKYNIGDVLLSKGVEPKNVKVGDTISYIGANNYAGKVITHEVIEIDRDVNGEYIFHTKGKANPIKDIYPVYEKQLYGVVIYKMKLLSFVYKIVETTYGLFIFVILPLLYIIGSEVLGFMLENEEKRRNIQ